MQETLTLAMIQGDTRWQDPAANRVHYAELMTACMQSRSAGEPSIDVMVLPETFTSGFGGDAVAEVMDGETMTWMKQSAKQHQCMIMGSLYMQHEQMRVNRFLAVSSDGQVQQYDKRHLFRMAGEHKRYAAGQSREVFLCCGWRVLPQVCYDLRFPVFSRNQADAAGVLDYDLAVYVANWPNPRTVAWQTLLRARAMENLSYVVGVNRIGQDGKGLCYDGCSAAIDPSGAVLVEMNEKQPFAVVSLSRQTLETQRERFPAYLDADGFQLML